MDRSVRFTPEVSLGALIQVGAVLASVAGVYAYVAGDLHEGELARAKYIPIVERLKEADSLKDERILNLSTAQIDVRRSIDSINDKLNSMIIEIEEIKARLPERHSELETLRGGFSPLHVPPQLEGKH